MHYKQQAISSYRSLESSQKSARSLEIALPLSKEEYENIITKLLQKNTYKNPAIRTVLTAGISDNGFSPSKKPTLYILIHDMQKLLPAKQLYKNGAKIITHDFARDHYRSKTTNYIEALKNQKKKNQKKATEILYVDKNTVLECSTSNIFIVKNKKLITPEEGVLLGITRKKVLQIAKNAKIHTQEKKVTKKQLLSADEVFITGSAKHILPVTKIDNVIVGDGKVGTLTKDISALYLDYLNSY